MEGAVSDLPRVGIIGLGPTGSSAASRVAAAGFPLSVFDCRQEAMSSFRQGCSIAPSARAVAESSDLIGVYVDDDEQVVDVVSGIDGLLSGAAPGATICVHSTVHPATCDVLARVAATQGVALVDAPVVEEVEASGFSGTLIAVGGEAVEFERWSPVFLTIADRVLYFGTVGQGMTAALVSSLVSTASIALRHDALNVATELGLDARTMAALVSSNLVRPEVRHLTKSVGIARRVVREFEDDNSQLSSAAARGVQALADVQSVFTL